ncbi:hypothetical protein F0562_012296 [Nyssa sinensis]|uniref:Uncharacterized protein n=1 Tax=Nyssa sinensis TaxID=561372 RepID=A0A5J4ZS05_9ASTE|nr:hypothetical protein F0562_012296 [Nyssa sinensis]
MHEKVASTTETSPPKDEEDIEEHEENTSAYGCGCLRQLCFSVHRNNKGSRRYLLQHQGKIKESWLQKKVKEIWEVFPRPEWKNFIHRQVGGAYADFTARLAAPNLMNDTTGLGCRS